MIKKLITLWIIVIGSLWGDIVLRDDRLKIDDFEIAYYIDYNQSLSIQSIEQVAFKPTSNKFSFGYLKGAIWLKLTLHNQSQEKEFILTANESYYHRFDLYTPDTQGGWRLDHRGADSYQLDRDPKHIRPKFPITLQPNERKTLYLRLVYKANDTGISYAALQIYSQKHFICCSRVNDSWLYIFFLGTLFYIIIFNIFLFVTIKDPIYIYYVGYLFANMLFVLFYSYTFADMGWLKLQSFAMLSMPLYIIFVSLLSMQYLNTKKHLPAIDRWLRRCLVLIGVMMPLIVIDYYPWFVIITTVMPNFTISLILYGAIDIAKKGLVEIRLYIVALFLSIASILVIPLMTFGLLPNSDWVHYSFIVVSYIEISLFSFVLAKRFHKIQNEIIDIKAKNEIVLEQKVKERTSKISQLLHERELLLKEIYHRVKNNFQMIISLLWLKSNQDKSASNEESFAELINRIQSMALVHHYLMGSESVAQINSQEYLAKVIKELEGIYKNQKSFEMTTSIEPHTLSIDQAMALAPIITEVVTNSIKHYQGKGKCKIRIEFAKVDSSMVLTIQDDGKGFDFDNISQKSFGLKMIEQFIKKLNRATIAYSFEKGTQFQLTYLA
ncbi:MAG: hypothetical protein JXQ76_03385 [Campylobacterales bacterium]|nr:hypothetical protein [Campylobacterales bacterium]